MPVAAAPRDPMLPTEAEICVAAMFGPVPGEAPLDLKAARTRDPRARIEELMREAMERGPVWVAFSGGRDSSTLLAIAAHVARRDGFALPVPITMTFPHMPESHEEDWQRTVLGHLDLEGQWVPLRLRDELDAIGPNAQRALLRHGVMMPPNAHAFLPMMDTMGAGGTIVSGGGGDELLDGTPARVSSWLISRRRPRRGGLKFALANDLPRPLLRRAVQRASMFAGYKWITDELKEEVRELELIDRSRFPIRHDRQVALAWADRHFRTARHSLELLATDTSTRVMHPFVDAAVMGDFARAWGAEWPMTRDRSLEPLVGDLLPREVLTRQSKADFARAFITDHAREWLAGWDGDGIDERLVRIDILHRAWALEYPHFGTLPLLQRAWLHSPRGGGRPAPGS